MKTKHVVPLVLAMIGIILATYSLMSFGWYEEYRESSLPDDGGNVKTDLGYGIRGVHNHTRIMLNSTMLDEEEKVQDYDDFHGGIDSMAGQVAARMWLVMLIGILMAVLFLPLAYISQTKGLEDRLGRWGAYVPLYVAQVSAITLILAPIWFSYEFTMGLDMDAMELTNNPSQALGAMGAWYVIFAGIFIQVAALMALSRTRLVYIKPLDEASTPEPME